MHGLAGRSCDELSRLLAPSFGPLPGEKMILTSTGKALFTCSGPSILTAVASTNPVQGLIARSTQGHASHTGDGTKAMVIMLAAALAEVEQQQDSLPESQRSAWRARISRATCWLAQEVVPRVLSPRLRQQARATATLDAASLRADAAKVAATAFGGHLGVTASTALATALVEALLPSTCPDAALIDVARRRVAGSKVGGTVVVAVGGAQPSHSRGVDGRLIAGGPASALMPATGSSCGLLLLGAHAAAPEMATAAEARRAGVPAKVELALSAARETLQVPEIGGGAAAPISDRVHSERVRWVDELRATGVRLLLSGAPLSPLTAQLCAQAGICAVPGVDSEDLRALCTAAGRSVLQEWPRPAQLRGILAARARFVVRGCHFETLAMGGRQHVHVRLESAPMLSTLVVRAPSDGLAQEFAMATTRAMSCMRMWLDPEEEEEEEARSQHASSDVLLSLPGAGAAELQMEACVRNLLQRRREAARPSAEQPAARRDGSATQLDTVDWLGALSVEQVGALRMLSVALLALPRQLHCNAQRASALNAFDDRWPVLLQRLRAEHDRASRCAVGLVLTRRQHGTSGAGAGLLEVVDAAQLGVLEPLGVKLRVLNGVLTCLAQLLRLDGAVPVRSMPQRGLRSRRGRRRRLDGCSSDDSESDESPGHGTTSSSSEEDEVEIGVLV